MDLKPLTAPYRSRVPHIAPLPLTGERTVPNLARENYWFRRHEAAYEWVANALGIGRLGTIVDAGSGEGYGISLLRAHSPTALSIGLELEWASTVHAANSYLETRFVAANLDRLPLKDASIEVLVSMQVVEHLWDLPRFLRESFRVVAPGGLAVFSTPNRLTFSPGLARGERPTNPFHLEEFDSEQLACLVADAGFPNVQSSGLFHNPRIIDWEQEHSTIVQAQIDAAVRAQPWPAELEQFVSSVTTDDFAIRDAQLDMSLDLIVVATKDAI